MKNYIKYFEVGDSNVGIGKENIHVNIIIGQKNGYIGKYFIKQLIDPNSLKHFELLQTRLLALIIPRTNCTNQYIKNKIELCKLAISMAIDDIIVENIEVLKNVEDMISIVNLFFDENLNDNNILYKNTYNATKIALNNIIYPYIKPINYNRRKKNIDFKSHPHLQIAFDTPDINFVLNSIKKLDDIDYLIIEVGTPLIKRYGTDIIFEIRKINPNLFIVADLKTLDTGLLETRMIKEASGDGIIISGLAPLPTIIEAIKEAHKTNIIVTIDMLNVSDPVSIIEELYKINIKPDIIEIHRSIDCEKINNNKEDNRLDIISQIRKLFPDILIAIAGGININIIEKTLVFKYINIFVVGRSITNSNNIKLAVKNIIEKLE